MILSFVFALRRDSPEIFARDRLASVIFERCSTWNARGLEFSSDLAGKTQGMGVFSGFTRKPAREAIAAYGRAMVGWVDTDDEESVAAFQRAMAPLDRHRRGATNGGREEEPDAPTPEAPVPPAPDEPLVTDEPTPVEA